LRQSGDEEKNVPDNNLDFAKIQFCFVTFLKLPNFMLIKGHLLQRMAQ
jgi:hypothetical protein